MSSKQTKQEMLDELRNELEPKVEEMTDDLVSTARSKVKSGGGPTAEWGANTLKKYAAEGHEGAQEALDELGVQTAAAEQNPKANAAGGREDPYRKKSLEERAQKNNAFGAGNENSPYDDGPSTNAAGDVGPSSSGSFADYNMAANANDARKVRLVDDPSKGEKVAMADSIREAPEAEEVRIVDLESEPEQAVDADPIYIAEHLEGGAGSFASHNSRPSTTLIPVNPEKLP